MLAWLTGRRPWSRIAEHLEALAEVFKDYDPRRLRRADPGRLAERVCELQCGNRAIHVQMEALRPNLAAFARIERAFGSLDAFASEDEPEVVARALAAPHGPHKLQQVGPSIAREMLRSVGFELAKPTAPVRRLLGAERLGLCESGGAAETARVVRDAAAACRRSVTELDSLLWMYCAPDQGDVCGADPDCGNCRLASHCAEGRRRTGRRATTRRGRAR